MDSIFFDYQFFSGYFFSGYNSTLNIVQKNILEKMVQFAIYHGANIPFAFLEVILCF